jgi:hypothetical protein
MTYGSKKAFHFIAWNLQESCEVALGGISKVMLEMHVECTAELRKICLAENERSNISKQHA